MTGGTLDAPHRRREQGPRWLELLAVRAYAIAVWVVAHVPPRLARWVIGTGSQAGYLFWPAKRTWSNANFSHVIGRPPDDPRVRKLALAAYKEYGHYLVEVMRLESLSPDDAIQRVVQHDLDRINDVWQESPGGLIFALGHVGNNEAAAAGVANRGWPVSVVADDSTFPEMFERFRRLREAWGVHVIPWRNLRRIYGVLKQREMLALLIDWGYRPDGIPVRLFGAWTTLPAGPATLAAKTRSTIVPVEIRRSDDGMFHIGFTRVVTVASSSEADIARATQEIADALEATIAAAPSQWYSFKPMWPDSPEEAAELEARAARMLGSADAGPGANVGTSGAPIAEAAGVPVAAGASDAAAAVARAGGAEGASVAAAVDETEGRGATELAAS